MTTEEKDCLKTKLKDIALSSFKLFSDNCKFENNLSAEEINSLKALIRNKDIIIQKADKGNTVVITDKDKYIEGVKCAISDSNKFVQLNITPDKYLNYIINVEKKFKQLFKDLLDNDKISKDEYDKICPKGSRPGILYGNPKIHKPVVDNLPKFRPILSAINTPGYNLAKFLIPILEPLTHNEFTIKDSFSFAKEITTYDSSLYMAVLDVESLFINISFNETINNCVSHLTINIVILGNSAKETFSNFWKQLLANHLLFLITYFINKLTEWQWVLFWVPPFQMYFYAIMKKNSWIIVQSTSNL